jgi:prephenate dehydratase
MGRKQQPIKASFQGERGAFSEEAARLLLGPEVEVVPCPRFQQIFERLANGEVDRAVVPIENTLHGSVHENYDHLLNFRLPIRGEVNLRIVHNLIAAPEMTFSKVRKVYSHPVAINQCLQFFADHPKIERESFYDTAGSVKMIMETLPPGAAAIASSAAAAFYGAKILKRSIEDDHRNFTRFFLLSRPGEAEPKAGPREWKTSIAFTLRNVPGALFRAMSAFALRDLSLTKIESRPLRGKPWEYLFYADFLGRDTDPVCQRALNHLQEFTDSYQLLGSYPKSA